MELGAVEDISLMRLHFVDRRVGLVHSRWSHMRVGGGLRLLVVDGLHLNLLHDVLLL
jgi:hypothetical protein